MTFWTLGSEKIATLAKQETQTQACPLSTHAKSPKSSSSILIFHFQSSRAPRAVCPVPVPARSSQRLGPWLTAALKGKAAVVGLCLRARCMLKEMFSWQTRKNQKSNLALARTCSHFLLCPGLLRFGFCSPDHCALKIKTALRL